MRKIIYSLKLKCYYQNVNYNKIGRRLVSKNKNEIIIDRCFTENNIKDLMNCERSMDKIMFDIGKKTKKEVEITLEEILESLELGLSNDIY